MEKKTCKTTCIICHKPFSYAKEDGEQTMCRECMEKKFRKEHTYTCKKCGKQFSMSRDEVAFFEKNGLYMPKHCPDCRAASRLAAQTKKRETCKDCGKEFIITVGESQWYRRMGLEMPLRCPDCRQARKTRQDKS